MSFVVYGIKNCDTVKKALTWLKLHNIVYDFHDYKLKGITDAKLHEWANQIDWESLLNKKGTTWRTLDDSLKNSITSKTVALALMKEKTSIIRRPIIEVNGKIVVIGFTESEYLNKLS